jgi:hypothetical protein
MVIASCTKEIALMNVDFMKMDRKIPSQTGKANLNPVKVEVKTNKIVAQKAQKEESNGQIYCKDR